MIKKDIMPQLENFITSCLYHETWRSFTFIGLLQCKPDGVTDGNKICWCNTEFAIMFPLCTFSWWPLEYCRHCPSFCCLCNILGHTEVPTYIHLLTRCHFTWWSFLISYPKLNNNSTWSCMGSGSFLVSTLLHVSRNSINCLVFDFIWEPITHPLWNYAKG